MSRVRPAAKMKRSLVSAALLVFLAACGDNEAGCAKLQSQIDAIDDTIDTIDPGPVVESMLARADALTAQMEERSCESLEAAAG